MIAKYAKFIILSSKAPSAKIAGKLGGINNINSLTGIDEKMSALNYDYEQAEQTMNTQIVMVTQPVLATRTMVVNKVKKVRQQQTSCYKWLEKDQQWDTTIDL